MSQAAADELAPGVVIADTYEVLSLVGRGGMGAVWAATHKRLPGKRVAIKVLHKSALDEEAYTRFRREAEIASRIGHPNIVAVLDFNTLPGGAPYLVLEFLDGESLAARLRAGPVGEAAALDIARQVGSALAAAHRAEVVHRDLKPDNVFLCPTDNGLIVKVLDFGISKIRNSSTLQTQESVLIGTPQYMSPEQAAGQNQRVDARTDVFALGAIVYEMLAGQPAFAGGTLAEVVFRVVYEAPRRLGQLAPSVSPQVVAAVERALAKDPAERFGDMASFVAALTGRPLATLDRPAPGVAHVAYAETAVGTPTPTLAELGQAPTQSSSSSLAPAAPAAPASAAPPVRRAWRLVVVGAVVGVAIAIAGWQLAARPPRARPRSTVAAAPDLGTTTVAPVIAVAEPAARTVDLGAMPAGPVETHRARVEPALPPSVIADLNQAERALEAGKVADALHFARKTLMVTRSGRAFSIITRAYCRAGDLGNARANLRSVASGERARVVRVCKGFDVDLD
jgi:serine/threonine-protein kinase